MMQGLVVMCGNHLPFVFLAYPLKDSLTDSAPRLDQDPDTGPEMPGTKEITQVVSIVRFFHEKPKHEHS
jgi:hypothetical protein